MITGIAVGCGGGNKDPNAPDPALATSLDAQRDFRELQLEWLNAADGKRTTLEPDLRRYLAKYPQEPKSRVARVYLAWVLVEQGRLGPARALVQQVRQGAPGTTRDFATVVEAAIVLRRGDAKGALALLKPLVNKIVDDEERLLLGELRVQAALAARQPRASVGFILAWLAAAAPEDRDAVQQRARSFLARLSAPALEDALGRLLAQQEKYGEGSPRAEVREWLTKAIVDRLVREALERDDAKLARRLVDSGVRSVKRGQRAADLARLAARGEVRPRVLGRQVGLVLTTHDVASSKRSAEVARGMARALGLPQRAQDPESVRMVTADHAGGPGELESALSRLAGDGATVLVAGTDPESAQIASRYAEVTRIPTITLAPIKASKPLAFTFVLAPGRGADRSALEAAAKARSAAPIAVVGAGGVPCTVSTTRAGFSRFPVQDWKRDAVATILLLGDAQCARSVVRDVRGVGLSPLFGLGFESATLFDQLSKSRRIISVTSGSYPKQRSRAAPESKKNGLEFELTWFTALGHDAASLSARAVADLPLERVDDRVAVRKLHAIARDRLLRAEADLLTSSARGFAGKRTLDRTISLRTSPGLGP